MRSEGDLDREATERLQDYTRRNGRRTRARAKGGTPAPGRAGGGGPGNDRLVIWITTDEHVVNDEAVSALPRDREVYQRGGQIVRVMYVDGAPVTGIRRPAGPRIEPVPAASLREVLTRVADFRKESRVGNEPHSNPVHPPDWLVAAVHNRGVWPGVRHLQAVVDHPVLRPDGTILVEPGYDPATGLLLMGKGPALDLPAEPTLEQAICAAEVLREVVQDFPFASSAHRSAWLAALLTPLARFAYDGPAPLFLVDANVRGSGKTLLVDLIALILTGERFTVATYTPDREELRKRITTLAMGGERQVLFDNLEGRFGNAELDAAITATTWTDRLLNSNRQVKLPLFMTWYATGNNVMLAGDVARRICHIRLESAQEHPEERQDFKRQDIRGWVRENRPRLLRAALVILRAYCVAGRPGRGLTPWGSFEGWTALVRSALVWAGQPDPGETRQGLREMAEVNTPHILALMDAIEEMGKGGKGVTAADILGTLKTPPSELSKDQQAELTTALSTLVPKLDGRGLGDLLRANRRKVIGGRFIDQTATKKRNAARWVVLPHGQFSS